MIAVVTEWTMAHGGGHYRRMLALRQAVPDCRLFVFTDLPEAARASAFGAPLPKAVVLGRRPEELRNFLEALPPRTPVCVDLRELPDAVFRLLSASGLRVFYYDRPRLPGDTDAVLVDLAGTADAEPRIRRLFAPECVLADAAFRRVPQAKNAAEILVSFGSTDPYGMTRRILRILPELGSFRFLVTLPLTWEGGVPSLPNGRCVRFSDNLPSLMRTVRTAAVPFGTTMWEALSAGRRVLILDPTAYHRKVSRLLRGRGVPGLPAWNLTARRLAEGLRRVEAAPDRLWSALRSEAQNGARLLASVMAGWRPAAPPSACPVCGASAPKVLLFYREGVLVKCRSCGSCHLAGPGGKPADFGKGYAARYGRSYLADRPAMDVLNRQRVAVLRRLLAGTPSPRVMDLGCAYGFFLDMARQAGFRTEGVEKVRQAAEYARRRLRLAVRTADLRTVPLPEEGWDAVTMWYVLEHLEDAPEVLARVAAGIRKGGVLALSVPNAEGFSYRFRRRMWAWERPRDHRYDFTLRGLDRLLGRLGLRRVATVWRGIRTERLRDACPALFGWVPETSLFRCLFSAFCRFTGSGDTLEAYYRKPR